MRLPRPHRVLIVDDQPDICRLMTRALESEGYVCRSTTDPEVARELLGREGFDLLVADITMPGIDGLELLAAAREAKPGCKVILITGHSDRNRLAQALLLGAFDYLEKPVAPDELLSAVSAAAGAGAETSRLHARAADALAGGQQARRASVDSVRALAKAVEAKDPYTRHHSEHVAQYAVALAERLGMESSAESIRVAALLHDIGKIGVPDRILTKSGSLDADEFEHIRRHPVLGSDILSNLTLFRREAGFVRHHHEAWDGSGYPDGLAGEAIPRACRILNVADSMDAMLMTRTYKEAYSPRRMLSELRRCSGAQFDPDIAGEAIRWCEQDPGRLIRKAPRTGGPGQETVGLGAA
jgi:putative nucleotidyltransferase with HDIG domain